jgi:polyferredoxin
MSILVDERLLKVTYKKETGEPRPDISGNNCEKQYIEWLEEKVTNQLKQEERTENLTKASWRGNN